mmetsp:Transcript_56193/g.122325  ORF Transcript_56193/g.122325 Transcript_56193/m.122325 type:complete len:84 (+) Transcript_56193:2396-2647(+)|eukprot:221550-Pleurochrysis_carterae.AAC.1
MRCLLSTGGVRVAQKAQKRPGTIGSGTIGSNALKRVDANAAMAAGSRAGAAEHVCADIEGTGDRDGDCDPGGGVGEKARRVSL